mmetsp:Transcript_131147/g.280491  ORF Transcript_131147/g.280491 Transcript_131147/m.280491 type:complete len:244 (-) Transcript_131147:784-1515(-)
MRHDEHGQASEARQTCELPECADAVRQGRAGCGGSGNTAAEGIPHSVRVVAISIAARPHSGRIGTHDEGVLQSLLRGDPALGARLQHGGQEAVRLPRRLHFSQPRGHEGRVRGLREAGHGVVGQFLEKLRASKHGEEYRSDAPDVALLYIEAPVGSGIFLCARCILAALLREPKVNHLQGSLWPRSLEFEILRADIVVGDAVAMAAEKGLQHVAKATCCEVLREATLFSHLLPEAGPLQKLHY